MNSVRVANSSSDQSVRRKSEEKRSSKEKGQDETKVKWASVAAGRPLRSVKRRGKKANDREERQEIRTQRDREREREQETKRQSLYDERRAIEEREIASQRETQGEKDKQTGKRHRPTEKKRVVYNDFTSDMSRWKSGRIARG